MTTIARHPAATLAGTAPSGDPATDPAGIAFREGMSRVASAVNIVTSDGPAGLAGFTATAVTSVSDHPPTMLVCLNRGAQSRDRLIANGVFCVNTLPAGLDELANVFAGRTGVHLDERFRSGTWGKLVTGAPSLESAVAAFDCRLTEVKDVATHHVLFGEVVAVRTSGDLSSLVWLHRAFRDL
jgi:flavin reductase (DIM6/NTAB) family NADH-FMN oxidoreductase RutF